MDSQAKLNVLRQQINLEDRTLVREYYLSMLNSYEQTGVVPGEEIYALLDDEFTARVGFDVYLRAERLGLLTIDGLR